MDNGNSAENFHPVIIAHGYGLMFHYLKIFNTQRYNSIWARTQHIELKKY